MQNLSQDSPGPVSGDIPEAELIRRAVAGDGGAFEVLMRRYNQLLFRTARSILKDDVEAEEALQDGYLRAWRGLAGFRAESKVSTWLVRIVTNEALARLRRARREHIPLEAAMASTEPDVRAALADHPDRAPDRGLLRAEVRRLVEEQIDGLPDAYRTVFVLRALEEMSVPEVARVLGIPSATVRSRFSRARALLRNDLAPELEGTLGEAFAFDGARCDRIVANVLARARAENLIRPGAGAE